MPEEHTRVQSETKQTTNAKLAIATAALLAAGGLAFAVLPLSQKAQKTADTSSKTCGVKDISYSDSCSKTGFHTIGLTCLDGTTEKVSSKSCRDAADWETRAAQYCQSQCKAAQEDIVQVEEPQFIELHSCGAPKAGWQEGKTYHLAKNLVSEDHLGCLSVRNTNNVTIDCQNHSISGNRTGMAVTLQNSDNVHVKNCTIEEFAFGVTVRDSDGTSLENNHFINNRLDAITLSRAGSSIIKENTIENNSRTGIVVRNSPNLRLQDTTIRENLSGISTDDTSSGVVQGSELCENNESDIYVSLAGTFEGADNSVGKIVGDTPNLHHRGCRKVIGNHTYEMIDSCGTYTNLNPVGVESTRYALARDLELPDNGACIELLNGADLYCQNHRISGNEIGTAIRLRTDFAQVDNITIEGCVVESVAQGIFAENTDRDRINVRSSEFRDITLDAVRIPAASSVDLEDTIITNVEREAVSIDDTANVTLTGSSITNAETGVALSDVDIIRAMRNNHICNNIVDLSCQRIRAVVGSEIANTQMDLLTPDESCQAIPASVVPCR